MGCDREYPVLAFLTTAGRSQRDCPVARLKHPHSPPHTSFPAPFGLPNTQQNREFVMDLHYEFSTASSNYSMAVRISLIDSEVVLISLTAMPLFSLKRGVIPFPALVLSEWVLALTPKTTKNSKR